MKYLSVILILTTLLFSVNESVNWEPRYIFTKIKENSRNYTYKSKNILKICQGDRCYTTKQYYYKTWDGNIRTLYFYNIITGEPIMINGSFTIIETKDY